MTKYALEIEQLNKTYRNGVKALKDINLNVEDGDLFAFLGPNGAGKTTCFYMIAGLIDTDEGDILLNQERINHFLKTGKPLRN